MPRCISTDCTSGYDSNPEKLHFFCVPKNENYVSLWKSALCRKNFVVKPGQTVCEKHFLPEDIIRQREILGPDGSVLGVSPYKVPRLRKGALPCIFPWVETMPKSTHHSQTQQKASNKQPIKTGNNANISLKKFEPHNVPESIVETLFLEKIKGSLQLPTGWKSQDIAYQGTTLFHVYLPNCTRDNELFKISNVKEVLVMFDGSIQINMAGCTVDPTRFGLRTTISNKHDLQDLLKKIHEFSIWQGFSIASEKPLDKSQIIQNKTDDINHCDERSCEEFTHLVDHNYNKIKVSNC